MQNHSPFVSSPSLSPGFRSHNSNVYSHLLNNFSFHPIKEVIVIAAIRMGGKDNEASIIYIMYARTLYI